MEEWSLFGKHLGMCEADFIALKMSEGMSRKDIEMMLMVMGAMGPDVIINTDQPNIPDES